MSFNQPDNADDFEPTQVYDDTLFDEESEIAGKIQYAVFRSTHFTSKFVNRCELSGIDYTEDCLNFTRLKAANQLSSHHCYGCIQYHPDNEELLNQANMFFETDVKIIHNHNWKGLPIKIQRSNGNILETNIHKDSCIRILNDHLMFYIEFQENNEIFHKWVRLNDYYSEKRNQTDIGILTLNPELCEKELILYVNESPEWMNSIRQNWIELFTSKFEESSVKYRFEYI